MPPASDQRYSLSELAELQRVLQLHALEPILSAVAGAPAVSTQSNSCSSASTGNCTGAALLQDLATALRPQR